MDDATISRATKALGNALARGAEMRDAMRLALEAAALTGCAHEYAVTVENTALVCGFDGDIEDGWIVKAPVGSDISALFHSEPMFGRLDAAVVAAMANGLRRAA